MIALHGAVIGGFLLVLGRTLGVDIPSAGAAMLLELGFFVRAGFRGRRTNLAE